MKESKKVLFVDDEPDLLTLYRRLAEKYYNTVTAKNGAEGLKVLKDQGPFAVLVTDYRMPQMDGVELLTAARKICPDTVRIMLTGYAESEIAINAVNSGRIFRFLTKPCSTKDLLQAINAGYEQYRLIIAERDILENTLSGSINVLTQIIGLLSPLAFSRAARIKPYVQQIATGLQLPNVWEFEIAAMLSQIGSVTLPPEVMEKTYAGQALRPEEKAMVSKCAEIGSKLISQIPRLENSAGMIKAQNQENFERKKSINFKDEDRATLGGHILKVALDFDQLLTRNASEDFTEKIALKRMQSGPYLKEALDALANRQKELTAQVVESYRVTELSTGMILYQDVYTKNEILLASRGDEVTDSVISRLVNFSEGVGVIEPIRAAKKVSGGIRKKS